MALFDRLMGLSTTEPKIPVHDFFAACGEIIAGRLTVNQVKTALALDAAGQAEFDELVALAPTGSTATALANKALFVGSIHGIFILAEGGYQGYQSVVDVRAKLGLA